MAMRAVSPMFSMVGAERSAVTRYLPAVTIVS
jgi:hypothetical protein